MAAVKNVGAAAVDLLVEVREAAGTFNDIEDICRRVDSKSLNRRTLESLIRVGAFDEFGGRGNLLESVDRIIATIQRQTKLRESGQTSMFDMLGESVPAPMVEIEISGSDDTTDQERVIWERDLLGVELTQSPFTREMRQQPENIIVFAADITADLSGQKRAALGQINNIRDLTTKRGDKFISLNLTLLDGDIEMVVWPNILEQNPVLWENGNFVSVSGEVRERFGRVSLSVETASEYQLKSEGQTEAEAEAVKNEPAPVVRAGFNEESQPRPVLNDPVQNTLPTSKPVAVAPQVPQINEAPSTNYNNSAPPIAEPKPTTTEETTLTTESAAPNDLDHGMNVGPVLVRVKETGDAAHDRYRVEDIMRLFAEFSGSDPAILEIETGEKIVRLEMPFTVQSGSRLTERLHELLGNGSVRTAAV
jgi:DNA polymerase III alpha subunit